MINLKKDKGQRPTINEIVIGSDGACTVIGEIAHKLHAAIGFGPEGLNSGVFQVWECGKGGKFILRASQSTREGAERYWTDGRVLVYDTRVAKFADTRVLVLGSDGARVFPVLVLVLNASGSVVTVDLARDEKTLQAFRWQVTGDMTNAGWRVVELALSEALAFSSLLTFVRRISDSGHGASDETARCAFEALAGLGLEGGAVA